MWTANYASIVTLSLSLVLLCQPALAQEPDRPRLEFGGNASILMSAFFEDEGPFGLLGGGPRVSVNLSPKATVELLVELTGPEIDDVRPGIYVAQAKLPFDRSHGTRVWSFTIGAAGPFSFEREGLHMSPFNSVTVGLARDQPLGKRVSSSLGVQILAGSPGFSVRIATGLGFGRYD